MSYRSKSLVIKVGFLMLLAVLSVSVFYAWWASSSPESEYRLNREGVVFFANEPITIAIADTMSRHIKGLSGLPLLPNGHGLWFEFSEDGLHGIWMKDMLFPIDIVWIDSAYRVVSVAKKISPETFPKTFFPTQSARFVLEMNAGTAENIGVVNGQIVRLEVPIGQDF